MERLHSNRIAALARAHHQSPAVTKKEELGANLLRPGSGPQAWRYTVRARAFLWGFEEVQDSRQELRGPSGGPVMLRRHDDLGAGLFGKAQDQRIAGIVLTDEQQNGSARPLHSIGDVRPIDDHCAGQDCGIV